MVSRVRTPVGAATGDPTIVPFAREAPKVIAVMVGSKTVPTMGILPAVKSAVVNAVPASGDVIVRPRPSAVVIFEKVTVVLAVLVPF